MAPAPTDRPDVSVKFLFFVLQRRIGRCIRGGRGRGERRGRGRGHGAPGRLRREAVEGGREGFGGGGGRFARPGQPTERGRRGEGGVREATRPRGGGRGGRRRASGASCGRTGCASGAPRASGARPQPAGGPRASKGEARRRSLRCRRIRSITSRFVIHETTTISAPQRGHTSGSTSKTFLRMRAQVERRSASAEPGSAGTASEERGSEGGDEGEDDGEDDGGDEDGDDGDEGAREGAGALAAGAEPARAPPDPPGPPPPPAPPTSGPPGPAPTAGSVTAPDDDPGAAPAARAASRAARRRRLLPGEEGVAEVLREALGLDEAVEHDAGGTPPPASVPRARGPPRTSRPRAGGPPSRLRGRGGGSSRTTRTSGSRRPSPDAVPPEGGGLQEPQEDRLVADCARSAGRGRGSDRHTASRRTVATIRRSAVDWSGGGDAASLPPGRRGRRRKPPGWFRYVRETLRRFAGDACSGRETPEAGGCCAATTTSVQSRQRDLCNRRPPGGGALRSTIRAPGPGRRLSWGPPRPATRPGEARHVPGDLGRPASWMGAPGWGDAGGAGGDGGRTSSDPPFPAPHPPSRRAGP